MSVYKSARAEGELIAVTKSREAVEYTLKITNNENLFPKRARFTTVKAINDKALNILCLVMEANEIYPHNRIECEMRLSRQTEAMANCRSLMALIDVCAGLYDISPKRVEYWTELLTNARRTISGWHKKDAERFNHFLEK